jgi:hypothetical protein
MLSHCGVEARLQNESHEESTAPDYLSSSFARSHISLPLKSTTFQQSPNQQQQQLCQTLTITSGTIYLRESESCTLFLLGCLAKR